MRRFARGISFRLAGYSVGSVAILFALGSLAADKKALPPNATSEETAEPDFEELIETLQGAVGGVIDVDLKNGGAYVRATLLAVSFDRKKGLIRSLRIKDPDTGKVRNLGFATIGSIRHDREGIYTAPVGKPRSAAERRIAKQSESLAEERAQWVARAEKNGVSPWPELSREEHQAAIEVHRAMMKDVSQVMPGMELYETHEFLFFSNIPPNQIAPYTAALDAMHDMMCTMYGIKRGEPVWKGKCLVVAFLNRSEFIQFEQRFLENEDPTGAYGYCHPYRDGRVIISCYRGDRPEEFGQMLVHETSHGFIHRYRTPVHPPAWINEGMADWIGRSMVPKSRSVSQRELEALQKMRQTGSMGGDFFKPKGNLEAWQYGIASSMTDFLIRQNATAYTKFIQGIKEGLTWQESLATHFKATPEQLIAAYAQAIGVANLRE